MQSTPKELDYVIEAVIKSFDNHLCNDDKAEKWFNNGGELIVTFSKGWTTVKANISKKGEPIHG